MLKITLSTWLKLGSLLSSSFYCEIYHEVEEYCLPGSDALLPVFLPGTQHYIPEDGNLEYNFQTNVQNNWF